MSLPDPTTVKASPAWSEPARWGALAVVRPPAVFGALVGAAASPHAP